jgi:hypothetical protein
MKKIYFTTSILFFIFITFICVQTFWKVIPESSLGGVQSKINKVKPSLKNWFSGKFQHNFDDMVNRSIGLKDRFIRSNNQFDYYLFKENNVPSEKVVLGKDNWLFQMSDIKGIYKRSVSEAVVRKEVDTLVKFNEIVKKNGKQMIYLAAPNKANIYEEYLPDCYVGDRGFMTNDMFATFVDILKSETDVPLLDGRQYFFDLKQEGYTQLFPKAGGHWSVYGSSKILEKIYEMTYPELDIEIEFKNEKPHYMDNDLINLINVWTPEDFRDATLKYPIGFKSKIENVETLPKILFVGDSACHLLSYSAVNSGLTERGLVVYYNSSLVSQKKGSDHEKHKLIKNPPDIYKSILDYDIIVVSMIQRHMNFPTRMVSYGFPNFVVKLLEDNPNFLDE